ncbi:unnamed protein product [Owenia fusiformis]|uniref:Uncharacterized protein n=1 Tax=Owenia fusiformis TaxID=6347 RepID=A0A8J1XYY9_OWEFU|nr:unnamed protein product [Owenia fusiformis]
MTDVTKKRSVAKKRRKNAYKSAYKLHVYLTAYLKEGGGGSWSKVLLDRKDYPCETSISGKSLSDVPCLIKPGLACLESESRRNIWFNHVEETHILSSTASSLPDSESDCIDVNAWSDQPNESVADSFKYGVNIWFNQVLLNGLDFAEKSVNLENILYFHKNLSWCDDTVFPFPINVPIPRTINGAEYTIENVKDLVMKELINNNLMDFYGSLLKTLPQAIPTFFINSSYPKRCHDNLANEIKSFKKKMFQIIFMNFVGTLGNKVDFNTTEISATHFTFCVYQSWNHSVVYCDSLGWSMPESLPGIIQYTLQNLSLDENPKYKYGHVPNKVEDFSNSPHVCQAKCSQYMPLQVCNEICGVAVIISFVIATLDPVLFKAMVFNEKHENVEKLRYLHEISDFNDQLRLVLIDWLVSYNIDLRQIFKASLSSTQPL